jgi:hypothetical protein
VRPEGDGLVSRDLALKLEEDYHELPLEAEVEAVESLYELLGNEDSEFYQRIFYTSFHAVEKSVGLLGSSVRW